VAALLVAVGAVGAQQAVAGGVTDAAPWLDPVKAKPGGTPGGFTVRLPDGRMLRFTYAPAPGSRRPTSGDPSSGQPGSADGTPGGSAAPSGSASGTPSAEPSGDPSVSALPLPVVSSLFPSPPSGSDDGHQPSAPPSRAAAAPTRPSVPPTPTELADPVQNGADAVAPGAAAPERPASTVPPPLGPQALLHPDVNGEPLAAARNPVSGALGHRGRLLGVGLALIGTGAALFGWRIRRL
jgi:hypothetical protein